MLKIKNKRTATATECFKCFAYIYLISITTVNYYPYYTGNGNTVG